MVLLLLLHYILTPLISGEGRTYFRRLTVPIRSNWSVTDIEVCGIGIESPYCSSSHKDKFREVFAKYICSVPREFSLPFELNPCVKNDDP